MSGHQGNGQVPKGIMDGVRIIDLTSVVMGPLATQMMADMGADVIKVEPIGGDISRQSVPARHKGMGQAFLAHNRNKRSVAIDLKADAGRAALLRLCEQADVVVYNIRPQSMERLGLKYEDVAAVNPRIIYAGAFGFSQSGPYAARGAYDDVLQGLIGVPWLFAEANNVRPSYAPMTFCDRTMSIHLVVAVLGALLHRERFGAGQQVDVPMFENLVMPILAEHLEGKTFEPPLGPMGHARSMAEERRPYKTADGHICVLIYNDRQWRAFLGIIGRSELMDDSRFANHSARLSNVDVVNSFLSETLATRTSAEWLQIFGDHDIPGGPMNSLEEILADEHMIATGFFREVDHPTEGKVRAMVYPTEFKQAPSSYRRHAPGLGEHSAEVLREAGFSDEEIAGMASSQVIRLKQPSVVAPTHKPLPAQAAE